MGKNARPPGVETQAGDHLLNKPKALSSNQQYCPQLKQDYSKTTTANSAGGMAQVLGSLAGKCKALIQTPVLTPKNI
jgi:hypothetical protein